MAAKVGVSAQSKMKHSGVASSQRRRPGGSGGSGHPKWPGLTIQGSFFFKACGRDQGGKHFSKW